MLKLFWVPGHGGGVPADAAWQARADTLAADSVASASAQAIRRDEQGIPPLAPALAARIDAWLRGRCRSAPLTLMVHGYQYDPRSAASSGSDDPFALIYGVPGRDTPAQLSLLPLVGECDEQGHGLADVAIAFAWLSRGALSDYGPACWNNDYQLAALDLAPLAAKALATVILALASRRAPVRILAHSLGTRVVGQAIGMLQAQGTSTTIERVLLLGGAEFCVDATVAYAGCNFDVVNVGSRIDVVLGLGAELACHPLRPSGGAQACVIGRNGLGRNTRWIDLQIDAPAVVAWFKAGRAPTGKTYAVDAAAEDNVHPEANLGHWAYYTNPGNRLLVRDLLQQASMASAALLVKGVPNGFASPMYRHFDGIEVPATPPTCAARRGEILIAAGV